MGRPYTGCFSCEVANLRLWHLIFDFKPWHLTWYQLMFLKIIKSKAAISKIAAI